MSMRKMIVYIIVMVFFMQSILCAVPAIVVDTGPAIDKDIFIPEAYGVIEKTSFDKYLSSRFVILLKDAHCNYDAQHNIAKILEVLIKDYKIDLVAMEGAIGDLDYNRFNKFTNEPAREKMADTFMKKGILTGPEYLTITKDGKLLFNIYGIEDKKLYIENFITFRQAIEHQGETSAFIDELNRVAKNLKERVYSEELFSFDSKSTQYYENNLSLTEWVKELNSTSAKMPLSLKNYPNIMLTLDSIALEEKIDFKKVELERAEAIAILEKNLSGEALKEIVQRCLLFRLGKTASIDYYKYLEELLKTAAGLDIQTRFSNLLQYIELVKLQSWINSNALFGEVSMLEDKIKGIMFQNDIQRRLNDISKKARILKGLFKLTLNREDLEYYREHRQEFMPQEMCEFINVQAPANNIPVSMLLTNKDFMDKVNMVIAEGEKFYDIAVERDISLVNNALRVMEERKKQSAVMVVGGFHTDGVTNLFESKGVGYVVITPKIVKAEKEGLYLSLMMDKRMKPVQETSTLSYIHPLASGAKNEDLLRDLGADSIRNALLELATLEYHKNLREYRGKVEKIEERILEVPFNITVEEGEIIINRNPNYVPGRESDLQLRFFEEGLWDVLTRRSDLAGFIKKSDNVNKYLNRLAIAEYRLDVGGTQTQGLLEKATKEFIEFYLDLCRLYEEEGWLAVREQLAGRKMQFLPLAIKVEEFGRPGIWPKIRGELAKGLENRGVEKGVVDGVVNYLLTMPAYGVNSKGEFYQTLFFSSYLEFVKEIFEVSKDKGLQDLMDRLHSYRFLQVYLSKLYEIEKTEPVADGEVNGVLTLMEKGEASGINKSKAVEIIARYLSGEVFDKRQTDKLDKLVARRIPEWASTQWVKVASGAMVMDEGKISDSLRRKVYVTVLARENIKDPLRAYERINQMLSRIPLGDSDVLRLTNRIFVHDTNKFLGKVEVVEGGYRYSDLGFPAIDFVRAIQRSKNNEQYFLYNPLKPEQKEAMKLYLARYGITVGDMQFVTPEEYKAIKREGRVVVTMLSNELKEEVKPVKGDRILFENALGSDIILMSRMAYIVSRPDSIVDLGKAVEDEIRELFLKYYLGAEPLPEVDITIDERGVLMVKLPKMSPFVEADVNSWKMIREIVRKAA